ncbi:MAG: imidazole glycerol phosphate synthase subunit HisH [Spirochaetes bacterium]|nr:imidazole glycerol phosphate synthase subunit HisH [Spirochaetota bacterium]
MNFITIINYNLGNPGSILNMVKKAGYSAIISSNIDDINKATKLILPGVGAFDNGINNLKELNLFDILNEKVLIKKIPILGICLGMQLMTKSSEEGKEKGFGWINAETKKFNFTAIENKNLKIPHMGWNIVNLRKNSKLFYGMENQENRFYFVHSYAVNCFDLTDILTTTFYGYDFVSSFEKENIIGVQFHPEKSHKFGMQLLKNFIERY